MKVWPIIGQPGIKRNVIYSTHAPGAPPGEATSHTYHAVYVYLADELGPAGVTGLPFEANFGGGGKLAIPAVSHSQPFQNAISRPPATISAPPA